MRWIRRLVIVLAVLAAAGGGYASWIGMEFGSRPADTLKPIEIAADIKFIDANGIRFAYVEEGQGPLVLLFHGYPETARSWSVVQHRIAAAGYHVVAPYMRGYPPSGFASDYGVPALGKDVLALIDAFGVENAVVVGHDWGAAAVYAATAENPAKIKKLVALSIPHARAFAGDPTIFLSAPHFLYYQLPWAERLVWSHDFDHIKRIYRTWAPSYEPPPAVLDDIKATLRVPGATASTLGYYWALFRTDPAVTAAAAAKSIAVPTLVLTGADDRPVDAGLFEKARPAFTGPYSFVMIDGVAHFPQLEAPDKTSDAIIGFVGSPQQ